MDFNTIAITVVTVILSAVAGLLLSSVYLRTAPKKQHESYRARKNAPLFCPIDGRPLTALQVTIHGSDEPPIPGTNIYGKQAIETTCSYMVCWKRNTRWNTWWSEALAEPVRTHYYWEGERLTPISESPKGYDPMTGMPL